MNTLPAGTGPSFELTPGKSYTAGSAERAALEAALDGVQATDWDVPVLVGVERFAPDRCSRSKSRMIIAQA